MADADAAALLCVSPANQTYLAGFRALLYSRPILLVVRPECAELIVPALEEVHARGEASIDHLHVYYEHPDVSGPTTHLECLDRVLASVPHGAAVAVEANACPVGLARHLTGAGYALVDLEPALTRMRERKDEDEIAMIEAAARVAASGVAASLVGCHPGVTELEVDSAGTAAVMQEVARLADAASVEHLTMTPSGSVRSVLPHALSTNRRLRTAEPFIHTRQVGLNGYRAELERTAFVGSAGAEPTRIFEIVRKAQQAAIASVKPGARCSDVDRAARRLIGDAGLAAYAVHRTGHGIGLSAHEPPYLRHDNDALLEAGMVITIEPGVYVPGVGGFRHSDTVLVGPEGPTMLTSYPSDLESLTLRLSGDPRQGPPAAASGR